MLFEDYCNAITEAFKERGIQDPEFDPECWRDNFNDGDSPIDAVDNELSCWTE